MEINIIRHATSILTIKNKRILVDPMLSSKGTMEAIPNVLNENKNPLVELPIDVQKIINVDAVILTHIHRDHFDETAIKLIPKDMLIFCQPCDKKKIGEKGFYNVVSIEKSYVWHGIKFSRTSGRHGKGKIGKEMGCVSGFVIDVDTEPSVYITGDTILCSEVLEVLKAHKPEIIIAFTGAAKFSEGEAITMTKEDIYNVCLKAPNAKIIAVHMEAWNHCGLTRSALKEFIEKQGVFSKVITPKDGEKIFLKR